MLVHLLPRWILFLCRRLVEESKDLSALAAAVDKVRKEQGWANIFIRLSSRSPKDAALSEYRFKPVYKAQLEAVQAREKKNGVSEEESPIYNQRMQALANPNLTQTLNLTPNPNPNPNLNPNSNLNPTPNFNPNSTLILTLTPTSTLILTLTSPLTPTSTLILTLT